MSSSRNIFDMFSFCDERDYQQYHGHHTDDNSDGGGDSDIYSEMF